ncbi:hypothetical protein [uncultured Desulfovibrio sp.]|uniref:Uncharacterized protein n=1 Tax=Candidatus Desulfovibrio intestinavium TaxID=2838534 RepID=A0A9D2HLY7_9BACT|nr:hypothetical protein [uncultured Desulfovibrio sp.]HJA78490.1 hypothetical protein [Candidatus Desulfovibrio intestinavium]
MIIVDGRNSGKEISNFANLEEILVDVMEEEGMESRVVTDVLVNNELFSEIYPHQAEDISTASINSVEVRSIEASEMALAIAGEMEKVAVMMKKAAHEIARLFREGTNADALDLLQDLVEVIRDFLSMLNLLRTQYLKTAGDISLNLQGDKFAELVSEMNEVMEGEDWILLADLLEYEFAPLCEAWRDASKQVHAAMQAQKD